MKIKIVNEPDKNTKMKQCIANTKNTAVDRKVLVWA